MEMVNVDGIIFIFSCCESFFVGNLYVVEARDYRNREDNLLCQGDIEREREGEEEGTWGRVRKEGVR